ncbi:MAG: class I SAM-dependent methyltransferase [Planctomycetota bacterium]|nr:class I SAM-dependent methyltransferase [Planctomycetota bacterium]
MSATQIKQPRAPRTMPTPTTTPPTTTDPAPSEGRKKYFVHLRTDVLAMIPDSARTFLSVGCGSGRTEAELIKRGFTVTGIELDPVAAAAARDNGLDMLEGDVNQINAQLADRSFDCLLYADVLEHIVDPVPILREHVARLTPGGCAIISVPNFRHHTVLRQLFLHGHIRYTDAGIFDTTHVRITTRRLIQEWFTDVGLTTDAIDYRLWRSRERVCNALTLGLFREFLAYQVILRGIKPRGAP